MPVYQDAGTPASATLWCVQAESHGSYARNTCNRIADAAVEHRELGRPVSGKPWIDGYQEAPVLFESEVLILQTLQGGSEQSGCGQQNQGERSLENDERLPWERARASGGTAGAAQRFNRIYTCRDPCRSNAEADSSRERCDQGE